MPNELSLRARIEKNRVSTPEAWLIGLEIIVGEYTVRVVNDNQNHAWRGETFIGFPFEFDTKVIESDGSGEVSSVSIKISNLDGLVMRYVRETGGGEDGTVRVLLFNTATIDDGECYFDETFGFGNIPYDDYWITLRLEQDYVISQRVPLKRYMKDFCPYQFKDIECGYSGAATSCNRSLTRCRELENSKRFGGEPGIPGGFYIES